MSNVDKTNKYGQRAGDCIHFDDAPNLEFGHCDFFKVFAECAVCKGLYCLILAKVKEERNYYDI